MTEKETYMIGLNVLNEVKFMDGSCMTKEEGEAFDMVINVLARLYARETMFDIRCIMGKDKGPSSEVFTEDTIERIRVYHQNAEEGLVEHFTE